MGNWPCGSLGVHITGGWSFVGSEPSSSDHWGVCHFFPMTGELQLPSVLFSMLGSFLIG